MTRLSEQNPILSQGAYVVYIYLYMIHSVHLSIMPCVLGINNGSREVWMQKLFLLGWKN
jgi:hypothetical protein